MANQFPPNIMKFLQDYVPEDELLPVSVQGFQNPQNLAKTKYTEGIAKNASDIAKQEYDTQALANSGSMSNLLKSYADKGLTLDQIDALFKTQGEAGQSPGNAVSIINSILLPALRDYDEENPPVDFPENNFQGVIRKAKGYLGGNPKAAVYQKTKKGLANVIAKGLLGDKNAKSEGDVLRPQELFPGDFDTPTARHDLINGLFKLLQNARNPNDPTPLMDINSFPSMRGFK